jgi:diadenosine tetraphosphatase ApaH/serine/threonine PP2A family protein phosphatase
VLSRTKELGIDEIVCLGDIVGYGPDPMECTDLVAEHCQEKVMGNHDFGVLYEPANFNAGAEQACLWTRGQLLSDSQAERRRTRTHFLGSAPTKLTHKGMSFAHGSPRRPINEYIFPDDVYSNTNKLASIFERMENFCFVGHTHFAGVFLPDPDFYSPKELGEHFALNSFERAIINVGSVGQPRDRDPRACFVTVSDKEVEFVRIEYDIPKTVDKIRAVEELDDFQGERLLEGR